MLGRSISTFPASKVVRIPRIVFDGVSHEPEAPLEPPDMVRGETHLFRLLRCLGVADFEVMPKEILQQLSGTFLPEFMGTLPK